MQPKELFIYPGTYTAPAANQPGFEVRCELFEAVTDELVQPAAEIEAAIWVTGEQAEALTLAPLTRDWMLPRLFDLTSA